MLAVWQGLMFLSTSVLLFVSRFFQHDSGLYMFCGASEKRQGEVWIIAHVVVSGKQNIIVYYIFLSRNPVEKIFSFDSNI